MSKNMLKLWPRANGAGSIAAEGHLNMPIDMERSLSVSMWMRYQEYASHE